VFFIGYQSHFITYRASVVHGCGLTDATHRCKGNLMAIRSNQLIITQQVPICSKAIQYVAHIFCQLYFLCEYGSKFQTARIAIVYFYERDMQQEEQMLLWIF
jgi:hypothetical protein